MKIIGHRGARGLAPENTLASLRKGLEHHADRLEFDVRVTRDSMVILHHDPEITDPNGDKHKISACDYKELKEHKPDLTSFEEALKTVGKTPLYIEVKSDTPLAPILKIIETSIKNDGDQKNWWLASFNQETLLELQKALPEIPKVVLEKWSGVRASRRARQLNTKLIAMNQRWLWWGFIRPMSRAGYELYAYTVNDPIKARRWASYGLAGIVTDYPDRFKN